MKNLLVLTLLCLFAFSPVLAQESEADMKAEMEALRAEVKQLKKDLKAIQDLPPIQQLLAQNAPLDVTLDVSNSPFKGDKNAKLTLVEFSDYQCPACRSYATQSYAQYHAPLVDSGQIKFVFFDFPLTRHQQAFKAAEAARCAGEQDQYWAMHDQLFANQQKLMPEDLLSHATMLGLDGVAFKECLDSGRHAEIIRSNMADGRNVRLRGTPHFAIGYTRDGGNSVNIVKQLSGQPFNVITEVVNELMANLEEEAADAETGK